MHIRSQRPAPLALSLPSSTVFAAAAAAMLATITTGLSAQNAVSPADRGRLEGSTATSYPLGRHNCRYQQLYSDVQSQLIKGHAYRRDALGSRGTIGAFRTEMAVSLSAVIQSPAKISRKFADNVGARQSSVLDRTWMSFPKTDRPATAPGNFDFKIPYARPYTWTGQGTLALDVTIFSNQVNTTTGKNFSADLDAHQLYKSARNIQPGYRFGQGCTAAGSTNAAWCAFELRHEGQRLDLEIDSRWGVPTTAAGPAQSALLLSPDRQPFAWPIASGCTVYGTTAMILPLAGNNDAKGRWTGVIKAGSPPPAFFEMTGQIISRARHSGEIVLSDASRLITPPPGQGIVSARVISASDRTKPTGTVSTSVPVTLFY